MTEAVEIFYYSFTKFINFLFGSYIVDGVSLGWILITVLLFGILINSVLNVPHGLISRAQRNKERSKIDE